MTDTNWKDAVSGLERWLPVVAAQQLPVTRADLLVIGPGGLVWFDDGRRRFGYGGSLLYLADSLDEWLRTEAETYVIESDSMWQSPEVRLRVVGASVEITLRRNPPDILRVPQHDAQRAVEDFLREFGQIVMARLPRIRELADLPWFPQNPIADS
jgi:hypothetical protein